MIFDVFTRFMNPGWEKWGTILWGIWLQPLGLSPFPIGSPHHSTIQLYIVIIYSNLDNVSNLNNSNLDNVLTDNVLTVFRLH